MTRTSYFGYIGSFCPTYGIFSYPPNWTGVGEDGLFASKQDFKPPTEYMNNTYILIARGMNDTTVHDQPLVYHNALTDNGVSHNYMEVQEGTHSENTWGPGLYNYLQDIFKK